MKRVDSVGRFVSPASFWKPEYISGSAWLEHAPFGSWLMAAHRPNAFVELGTHTGFSYLSLCQAAARAEVPCRAFAVDTWLGDEQTGFYGEDVFDKLAAYHDPRYSAFSRLVRATFDEAVLTFEDGSIDLLHIDGLHTYEAVRHDFETWLPKLSRRAIVLFHDTNVRERDFGVHRLWSDLSSEHPGFEFAHGHGLGVLAVGDDIGPSVRQLLEAEAVPSLAAEIRGAYARLGDAIRLEFALHSTRELSERERAEAAAHLHEVRKRERAEAAAHLQSRRELVARDKELAAVHADLKARGDELADALFRATELQRELSSLVASKSWRITRPLRAVHRVSVGLLRSRPALPKLLAGGKSRRQAVPAAGRARRPSAGRRRIVFLSGESHTPGHRYRIVNIASALPPAFFETAVVPIADLPKHLDALAEADVLWVWRVPHSSQFVDALERARAGGARVVYDIDDLMFEPDLARTNVIDGIRTKRLTETAADHFEAVQRALVEADHCTAPTPTLARRIRLLGKPPTIVPNGFDSELLRTAREANRGRLAEDPSVVRIGYAAGTFTHQQDFAVVAPALARVLTEHPEARFVSFEGMIDLNEFPEFRELSAQIELRPLVPLEELPREYARFDINIAPLEVDNPFCEAKSELKYFEAALAGAVTIASPTEPFAAAIRHGETGLLAKDEQSWYEALSLLVEDHELRSKLADAAYRAVLWPYGPERRALVVNKLVNALLAPPVVTAELSRSLLAEEPHNMPAVHLPDHDVLYESRRGGESRTTVVVPLFNYTHLVLEALESVRRQTEPRLDLVVVDDCSTDDSTDVVHGWLKRHESRFNRVALLRNRANSGLPRTRNAGVAFADTELFMPLDPDNVLLPRCVGSAVTLLDKTGAAVAFPTLELFGQMTGPWWNRDWDPMLLQGSNYIDAMALVRRSCWLAVGGYSELDPPGWEDYDLWCKFVERGFFGARVPEVTARYRVHTTSKLFTTTDLPENKARVVEQMTSRHPWLNLALKEREPVEAPMEEREQAVAIPGDR